ncbi:nucleotide kinase domain-containing protein [Nocardioides sp. BYT-33-1]|uniref:nucleotide kinase domain-containing protein n=1 Tax=Nocardioides sp. BYT-33-1 TaxID=3416952 RepID=UPI003F52BB61
MSQAQVLTARPPLTDAPTDRPAEVVIAGRRVSPTVVFDTYWEFAARRQAVYEARLTGRPGPWTDDPILQAHRFTNCFRAADRVSQYLISEVLYAGDADPTEVVFRALLFKMFNKVSTWELLTSELGQLTWAEFDHAAYDTVLGRAIASGQRLYSAAYVIPPPKFGAVRKHTNHLLLLAHMMSSDLPGHLQESATMQQAFETLRAFPGMGDFLAFQFLIDLNYSEVLDFDEMDFVVAGPGARDGLRKCFGPQAAGIEADLIRYMADTQDMHFERLGLDFGGLRGRPLQLIDCQNLFCEVDKYARVAHPDVAGISGRSRIKQRFTAVDQPPTAWFPPKWGINDENPAAFARRSPLVAVQPPPARFDR